MTLVKICGLTRPRDIEAVNALMPDMAGFVFYGPSRRCVTRETARELGSMLAPSIVKVGVFVDEDPLVIADLVGSGVIDAVQLHGVEDSAYIHGLRRLVDAPVIKTFLVRDIGDIEAANRSDADCILLDAGMGSGRTFDWSLLDAMKRDYILSGGLNPGNIRDAVEMLHPYGVDVSSGVETDGRKDPSKMSAFLETVHRCTSSWARGPPPGVLEASGTGEYRNCWEYVHPSVAGVQGQSMINLRSHYRKDGRIRPRE